MLGWPSVRSSPANIILAALAGVGAGFGMAQWSPSTADRANASEPAAAALAVGPDTLDGLTAPSSGGSGGSSPARSAPDKRATGSPAKSNTGAKPAAPRTADRQTAVQAPAAPQNKQRKSDLFENWIALDPASAAAWAAEIFARGGGDQLLRQAVRGYARRNPRAAAAWASSLASPLVRDSAVREVFETWASLDPRSAGAEVSSLPPGSARSTAANVVAGHFARLDFEGALTWMGSLAVPLQGGVLPVIMRAQWSRTGSSNPGAALPWLLAQTSNNLREQGIRFIVGEWAKRDPLAALAQAAFISDRIDRKIFFDTAMGTYIATNPREATLWIASQPASRQTDGFMLRALSAWAAFEPQQTANWAAAREDGGLRARTVTAVAESWAKVDPDGLAAWLRNLPDAATRDAALEGATRVWMHRDPVAAADWASGIADADKRKRSLTQIVGSWKSYDRAAALDFVRTTPLIDDKLRATLLR